MIRRLRRECFHSLRFRAVLTFTDDSCSVRSSCKGTCPGLVAMSYANLQSIIVEAGFKRRSMAVEFFLQNLKQRVAISQALPRIVHHAARVADSIVEMLHFCPTSIAGLEIDGR